MPERYTLHEQLGHGGTARVFRATDLARGCEVALKQLILPQERELRDSLKTRFSAEFHTLAQLKHPRVIEVFDYGVTETGAPYYTMELLDGGDLREHRPVSWRRACAWLFDVCSSLALLHARRLLHRDVSPRNVRCTRDGRAKLIDFGALTPMLQGSGPVVGTPAFIAPESLYGSALDARTDLFSLGATLYNVLTGELPYPARSFAEVREAWQDEPQPPSTRARGIPSELDDLVLAMLCVEPSRRPRSAFEVMQRLAAIAGFEISESEAVTQAYLSVPTLIGREPILGALRQALGEAAAGAGAGLLVCGEPGVGRSRLLDAYVLEAKTRGALVLRAGVSGDRRPFALALALSQALAEARPAHERHRHFAQLLGLRLAPSAATASAPGVRPAQATPAELQRQICEFVVGAAEHTPLLIAVDDVDRADEPSAAVLMALLAATDQRRICLVMTAESGTTEPSRSLQMLATRCRRLWLSPLTREQTRELFSSIVGDMPQLSRLSDEIYAIARGNPRLSLDVAQHLLDRGVLRYSAGGWSLPDGLPHAALPRNAEEALVTRVRSLSEHARWLAEVQALSFRDVFERATYHRLRPDLPPATVEAALNELSSKQVLASDGRRWWLASRLMLTTLLEQLSTERYRAQHAALAELYADQSHALIYHLFGAGRYAQGLDALIAHNTASADDARGPDLEETSRLVIHYPLAIVTAEQLGRGPRVIHDLRRWLVATASSLVEAASYRYAAPAWLAQLKRDSGLQDWLADTSTQDPHQRLLRALQSARERHRASPESERVYSVEEALHLLAEYVVHSIPIGVRTMDYELLESLPPLLDPFVSLSPILQVIRDNALAAFESTACCQYARARVRWIDVLDRLASVDATELHVERLRRGVALALGTMEATFGLADAERRIAGLGVDPFQELGALQLRKTVMREQGDWKEAARLERLADELALRSRSPSMFLMHVLVELKTFYQARDLSGLKRCGERIASLAASFPGWIPCLHDAQALFELVRGDFAAAKLGFERVIALTQPDARYRSKNLSSWILAQTGLADALLQRGEVAAARDSARAALDICARADVFSVSDGLRRIWALAEAKLANLELAREIMAELLRQQLELGVTGLKLGLSYETCALIAIQSGDEDELDRYARLTAREYRHGAGCPLGARYDALLNEARRAGFEPYIEPAFVAP